MTDTSDEKKRPFAMRKVMSIGEIAEVCRKEDVQKVVSVDAPLVTALNARLPRPMFGFAYTPVQIADSCATSIIQSAPDTDLEMCEKIRHITGGTLRFTHSTVRKIREIRRYTNEVSKYLSRKEKEVYEAYLQTTPLDNVMNKVTDQDLSKFYNGANTAVVDVDFFTSIDKMMNPLDYILIDNSSLEDAPDEDFTIDTIYSIGNDRQIADCVADLITPENCNDVAIVLDANGSIADAVRSALYKNDIPFKNNLAVKDLAPVRDFIRFINAALDYDTVRAGDVRELFSSYGAGWNGLSPRTDRYLLCRITPEHFKRPDRDPDDVTLRLMKLMKDISSVGVTFDDVIGSIPKSEGKSSVKILLRDMGIGDKIVDRKLATDLEYAVNNIDDLKHNEQIPEDERHGVLLADCRNSIYIDRAIVFFIGLDDAWHNSPSGKEYITDPQGFEEKEAMRLRILLQQGDRRFYIIRPATGGKETTPCQTFETIADMEGRPKRIKGFNDICRNIVSGSWHQDQSDGSLPCTVSDRAPVSGDEVVFDKTSYNKWVDCPYKFAFSLMLKNDREDNKDALFGSYVHDFAEFSFCFPGLARECFEDCVTRLLDAYSGISSTCMSEFDESKFRNIMHNVMSYTASIRPTDLVLDGDNLERPYPNMLIAEEPRTGNRYSMLAENYIRSAEGHAFQAKPDLVIGNTVVDYKTGSAKNLKDISGGFKENPKEAEFQPLIYLKAVQERDGIEDDLRFNLVYFGNHVAETVNNAGAGDADMSDSIRTVELTNLSDREFMESHGVLDELYEKIKDVKTYKDAIANWSVVKEAILDLSEDPDWLDAADSYERLHEATGIPVKAFGTILGTRHLGKLRTQCRTMSDSIVVTRRYMDDFIDRLDRDAVEARDRMELPVFSSTTREKVNCKYCDYKSMCMSTMAKDYQGGEEE